MKVMYKTTVSTDGEKRFSVLTTTVCCCERMRKAISGDAVVFVEEDWASQTPSLQIRHSYYAYDGMSHDIYDIDFCPFCGEKVECVEAQRTRMVERVSEAVVQKVTYEEVPDVPPASP